MENYLNAKNEFNQKLRDLKNEIRPTVYASDLKEIVLYQKLLELQKQINWLKIKLIK